MALNLLMKHVQPSPCSAMRPCEVKAQDKADAVSQCFMWGGTHLCWFLISQSKGNVHENPQREAM